MKSPIYKAALVVCMVLAGGAGGAETGIRRFDGKTVASAHRP